MNHLKVYKLNYIGSYAFIVAIVVASTEEEARHVFENHPDREKLLRDNHILMDFDTYQYDGFELYEKLEPRDDCVYLVDVIGNEE
jgi:hypothetical protein